LDVAHETIKTAFKFALKTSLENQIFVLLEMAAISNSKGQYRQSLEELNQADALLMKMDEPPAHLQASVWDDTGWIYLNLGNFDKVYEYAQRTIEFSQRENLSKNIARAHNLMGVAHYVRAEYDQAIDWWEKSLPLNRAAGNRYLEGEVLNNLGETLKTLGKFRESLPFGKQALSIFQELSARHHEIYCLINLANVHLWLDELDVVEQTLQIVENKVDKNAPLLESFFQSVQLQLEIRKENQHGIRESATKIWGIFPQLENPDDIANIWQLMGQAISTIGELDLDGLRDTSADECFKKSIEIFEASDMKHDKARSLFEWAKHLQKSGKIAEAQSRYQEARAIFEGLNLPLWAEKVDGEWAELDR
jgi:tetratricopeptide (TPR) repeat protein